MTEPMRLLTTREAGERLGLAGGYIGQLVNAGKLTPYAFAGPQRNALFTVEGVDEFAAERASKIRRRSSRT